MENFLGEQLKQPDSQDLPKKEITIEELCQFGPDLREGRNTAATIYFTLKYISPRADLQDLTDSLIEGGYINDDQVRQTVERLKEHKILVENPDGTFEILTNIKNEGQSS